MTAPATAGQAQTDARTGMPGRRVALVTGSATGIGRGIAAALLQAGHHVVVGDVDREKGAATAGMLQVAAPSGVECRYAFLDARQRASFDDVADMATRALGSLDIVVNNAALTRAVSFEQISAAEWDDVIAVNLRSVLFCAQACVAAMREKGWGRIVNLTSAAGQRGGPAVQGVHYAASKAGIIGATRYFAHELGGAGITVNAIAPGPILTEQTHLAPPEKLAAVKSQLPVGRLGETREVGALAAFLCSDDAGFITGATFDINGGLIMR